MPRSSNDTSRSASKPNRRGCTPPPWRRRVKNAVRRGQGAGGQRGGQRVATNKKCARPGCLVAIPISSTCHTVKWVAARTDCNRQNIRLKANRGQTQPKKIKIPAKRGCLVADPRHRPKKIKTPVKRGCLVADPRRRKIILQLSRRDCPVTAFRRGCLVTAPT